MSLLADYLRRVGEGAADEEAGERVTTRRLALSVAATVLGAALVRRLRRSESSDED